MFRLKRSSVQRYSLVVLIGFCCYLVSSVAIRSRDRRSIFSASSAFASQDSFAELREPGGGGSKLQLQDFRRVAVKDGKPAWEIRASDAEFYSKDGVTNVNNAKMIVFRGKDGDISVSARSAKLHMLKDSLSRVELAGDTLVEMADSAKIRAEIALYDVENGKVFAPGPVQISGEGYIIDGEGLQANLQQETVEIQRNVRCVFETSAKVPDAPGLPFGGTK